MKLAFKIYACCGSFIATANYALFQAENYRGFTDFVPYLSFAPERVLVLYFDLQLYCDHMTYLTNQKIMSIAAILFCLEKWHGVSFKLNLYITYYNTLSFWRHLKMSEEAGGKIKSKRQHGSNKPYERRKVSNKWYTKNKKWHKIGRSFIFKF